MPLFELHAEPPPLDRVLVLGLDGWIDAGAGGAQAVAAVRATVDDEVIATFDADALVDHRARRPVLTLTDGVIDGLTWPAIELRAGTDAAGKGLLLLSGPEPDLRWHEFTADVVGLAERLGVSLTVGLGAFPAPVPHTRPVRLAGTCTSRSLADLVGFIPGTIEVPAGIGAVLETAMQAQALPAVGLWARVPHYVAALPYPAAAAALLDGLRALAGVHVPSRELETAAQLTRTRVDGLIAASEEHTAMVRVLEQQWDAEVGAQPFPQDLPSGDEIAAELERFLRGEPGG